MIAEDRIRRHYLDRAANERQQRDAAYQRASQVLERTGDGHKSELIVKLAAWSDGSPSRP